MLLALVSGCAPGNTSSEPQEPPSSEQGQQQQQQATQTPEPAPSPSASESVGSEDPDAEDLDTQGSVGSAAPSAPGTAASTAAPSQAPSLTPSPTQSVSQPPSPSQPVQGNAFTMDEVSRHAVSLDCWVAIDGSVYDLTKWVQLHPGGAGRISALCGTDATAEFTGQHGGQARPSSTLDGYRIGTLLP